MKKITIMTAVALTMMSLTIFQACNKDDNKKNQEFVADNTTFSGFENWQLAATNQGPDPALGMAHGGNDNTVTRRIYFKNGQNPANGKYPVGTVVVKRSTNPSSSVNEVTALVKRGNNFNPANNDWEWFMLMPDGTIATDQNGQPMRGASLMGGMCGSCHSQASAKDFVFSK